MYTTQILSCCANWLLIRTRCFGFLMAFQFISRFPFTCVNCQGRKINRGCVFSIKIQTCVQCNDFINFLLHWLEVPLKTLNVKFYNWQFEFTNIGCQWKFFKYICFTNALSTKWPDLSPFLYRDPLITWHLIYFKSNAWEICF